MTLAKAVNEWLKVEIAGRGISPHTLRADIATFTAHLTGVDPRECDAAQHVHIPDLSAEPVTQALSSRRRTGAADKSRARLHGTLSGRSAPAIYRGCVDPMRYGLVKTTVSQVNGHAFSHDMHQRDIRQNGESQCRLDGRVSDHVGQEAVPAVREKSGAETLMPVVATNGWNPMAAATHQDRPG